MGDYDYLPSVSGFSKTLRSGASDLGSGLQSMAQGAWGIMEGNAKMQGAVVKLAIDSQPAVIIGKKILGENEQRLSGVTGGGSVIFNEIAKTPGQVFDHIKDKPATAVVETLLCPPLMLVDAKLSGQPAQPGAAASFGQVAAVAALKTKTALAEAEAKAREEKAKAESKGAIKVNETKDMQAGYAKPFGKTVPGEAAADSKPGPAEMTRGSGRRDKERRRDNSEADEKGHEERKRSREPRQRWERGGRPLTPSESEGKQTRDKTTQERTEKPPTVKDRLSATEYESFLKKIPYNADSYDKALAEAADKGKPLVLIAGTKDSPAKFLESAGAQAGKDDAVYVYISRDTLSADHPLSQYLNRELERQNANASQKSDCWASVFSVKRDACGRIVNSIPDYARSGETATERKSLEASIQTVQKIIQATRASYQVRETACPQPYYSQTETVQYQTCPTQFQPSQVQCQPVYQSSRGGILFGRRR